MKHLHYIQTWWEKTHLSIEPYVLKDLLLNDGDITYFDPMTKKYMKITAQEIRDNKQLEYNNYRKEYTFPLP